MTTTTSTPRELAHRITDGIEVTLQGHPDADRTTVHVLHAKNDEAFEIEVRAGERALDVFHHPYAYRAVRDRQRPSTLVSMT